ncbi:MAG TPA: RHS repeat-associated core domain-containing protein [Thermoanaerobaculia bacterium]
MPAGISRPFLRYNSSITGDGTKLGRRVTGVGLAGLLAGSLLSNLGYAYGLDAAKRLTTAYAGPGSVTGADAAAAIAAFERFKYEYGSADQLQKETREVEGSSVGYETGGDGRPDSRQLDAGPRSFFLYDVLKRRTSDDRFTFTWHYDGRIATAVVKDCWPIEHGESQGPACAAGFTRPASANHKLVFSYDALSRLLTRTHLGEIPSGGGENDRPFVETREYLFDGNTLLAEAAKAKDGAIRWRKTYVPGADLHDHVQVRVETYDAAQSLVSDRLYAYIRDEQGTVLALADEASDPKNPAVPIRYLYTPYGNAHAETGPELRKGSYGFGITSVKDASGATRTQTATGTLPGGVRLSFGIDVDPATFSGIVFERRATDGTWGALTAAEMAIGRAPDAANSEVDILPLGGFAFDTGYRVRTTAALKDILGRPLVDPKVLEFPQTPPVIAPGDIGASSYEYDRRFPIEYDSLDAASNDANGMFPGGQPMGFQGQYTDPLLGFLITPNRVYDARNGVWLSQDPLGDRDSPNLYGFVGARPHEKTDPLGLGAETACIENPMLCAGIVQGVKDLFWGIVTAPARLMERDYQETVAKARAYNRGGRAERERVALEFGKEHNAALVEMAPVVGTARRIGEAWEECAHSGASFECGEKLVPAGAGVVTDATLVYGLTSKAAQLSRAGESASVAGSAPRAAAMDAVAGSEFADDALRMTEQPFAPRKSGETIYTRAGRLAHAEVPLPPGFKRRVRLPSGKEMDAYNPDTREVIEIKPNTRRQVRRGEKQVGGYCAECDVEKGPGHTGRVLPYDPAPFLDRIKGEEP